MPDASKIPLRSELPARDLWNLSKLFSSEEAWEEGLKALDAKIPLVEGKKEGLGSSREAFADALAFFEGYGILDERLGTYAFLRQSEDEGSTEARGRLSRYQMTATKGQAAWAWLVPSIQALPEDFVSSCLSDPRFGSYRVFLERTLRFKPHVLSEAEERLLALQSESSETAHEAFTVLTNVDIDFGSIDTPEGPRPLSQSSFVPFLRRPDRELRKKAYSRFYGAYEGHKNVITALYNGSAKLDKYRATVRKFPSARAAALFPDDVSEAVYDNLVSTISSNLNVLHEYYEFKRRALKVDELRHYDVYVPLAPEAKARHPYEEAVGLVCGALDPLGEEYVGTLRAGLEGGWVDRYENRGKRSGAFSAGSFSGDPHILLNYKDDSLHDVFTMAHEGGHSMHSYYSGRSNPFLCYSYTIFEAEVASTFNEQLLFARLYERAESDEERVALVNSKLDDLIGTLFRQTMFAEFERDSHAMLEAGEPLTVDSLRAAYRRLLEKYFGPALRLEPESDLEGLRIPHFYRAFYVYKYATGISASIALSERVRTGGKREREDYFAFLRSGGSRFPIEALKVAGVDMSSPAPVEAACAQFARYAAELKRLLGL